MTKLIFWVLGLSAIAATFIVIVKVLAWIFLIPSVLGTARAIVLSKETYAAIRSDGSILRLRAKDEIFVNTASIIALAFSLSVIILL